MPKKCFERIASYDTSIMVVSDYAFSIQFPYGSLFIWIQDEKKTVQFMMADIISGHCFIHNYIMWKCRMFISFHILNIDKNTLTCI